MIQITAQMRVLVAVEPVDGRKGIDSLALAEEPFSGCVFVLAHGGRTGNGWAGRQPQRAGVSKSEIARRLEIGRTSVRGILG